ncbi:MAG: hypothetical protein HZA61_13795 [Candidatus Eisenbacteria bacterium]|uniref:Tetratricopeptide repeat protein n=1 Tax=Eiseniibacteriota bacterium TaxID=2212470 RepID=A0A933SFV0_UNCEI|nr:hypothetical protein [Candidatus Eisenbacteria bacterium]
MSYTIEDFISARQHRAELEGQRNEVLERMHAGSADANVRATLSQLEEALSNADELIGEIASSPEGLEESSDCLVWGMEALIEDDTARALEHLDLALALDLANFRKTGECAFFVQNTGATLGKICAREGLRDKAVWSFEAVLEAAGHDETSGMLAMAAESAVRLSLIESELGHSERARDLLELAISRGRDSDDSKTRGMAAWAAAQLGDWLRDNAQPARARAAYLDALVLAEGGEGLEGVLAGAQAGISLVSGQTGPLPAAEAAAIAHRSVALAQTGAEGGHPYARQVLCFSLVNQANVLVDADEHDEAADALQKAFELSSGLPKEAVIRRLISMSVSRFPDGWFGDDEDPDDDDE